MFDEKKLEMILSFVALQAKELLSDKLDSITLFGSYARGDYDDESDIDIMILADVDDYNINELTSSLYERLYKFELEHDCVLSLCLVPKERFTKYKEVLPFYRNMSKEGISIAV